MYNLCLRESVFSTKWKQARLLLLHKEPDKSDTSPSSFQLLCIFDTAGKLFERILQLILNEHFDKTGGLSTNLFGFRKGCFIEDAINKLCDLTDVPISMNDQIQATIQLAMQDFYDMVEAILG